MINKKKRDKIDWRDIQLGKVWTRVPVTVKLGLAATLFALASQPLFLVEHVALIAYPDHSLLGQGEIWNPALSSILGEIGLADLSFWFFAILLGACFVIQPECRPTATEFIFLMLGVSGLAFIAPHGTFLDAFCLVLALRLPRPQSSWPYVLWLGLLMLLCLLVTLEVGLIVIVLSLTQMAPILSQLWKQPEQRAKAAWMSVSWVMIIALPALLSPAYRHVIIRPISWIWLETPISLLPSMVPIWESVNFGWPHYLVSLFVLHRWVQVFRGRINLANGLVLAIFTLLGAGCARYFWLATIAVVFDALRTISWAPHQFTTGQLNASESSTSDLKQETQPSQPQPSLAPARSKPQTALAELLIVSSVAAFVGSLALNWSTFFAADMLIRRIDRSQWNASGTVVLTNLDETSSWLHPDLKQQYQPILSDRWDVYANEYATYAATCEDWRHWRRESYLRANGTWGGYDSVFRDWEPLLVVLDTADLHGIHRISLDSKWKLVGIDFENAYFALRESRAMAGYVQHATDSLALLELPNPRKRVEVQRVVAVGTASEACQVSAALTALRVPYAGLRVAPSSGPAAASTVRALAYAELAHRSQRYSGSYSLLDGIRTTTVVPKGGPAAVVNYEALYQRNLTASFQQQANSLPAQASLTDRIRSLLLQREFESAAPMIKELDDPDQIRFFTLLTDVGEVNTMQLIHRFAQELEDHPRSSTAWESSFYLGCLAIELGDPSLAASSLSNSIGLREDSPFAALARFYLMQLEAP